MKHKCKYYIPHLETIKAYIGCLYDIPECCSGGLLHILLDEDNLDNDDIFACLRECLNHPEKEEAVIGKLICEEYLKLSMPERRLLTSVYIEDFSCYGDCDEDCINCGIEKGFDWE